MCSETANYSLDMMQFNAQPIVNSGLSIYIPYIAHNNANEEYIKYVFKVLNISEVSRVDFQDHGNQVDKIAVVHMKQWYTNVVVEHLQEKIMDNNQEARIIYNDPDYWILLPNKRSIPENYDEHLSNLQNTVFDSNKAMAERIYSLEQKNYALETTIKEMQWCINLHDVNIRYLVDQNTSKLPDNSIENNNNLTNNSCCGAVSDAWNPYGTC